MGHRFTFSFWLGYFLIEYVWILIFSHVLYLLE